MKGAARIALVAWLLAAPEMTVASEPETQEMQSLETIVKGGAELSVVAFRCAGLFHSVWDFVGEAVLGVEATEQAKSNTARFLDEGTKLRIKETGDPEHVVNKMAVAEAFAMSSQYFEGYRENVAAGREAYATDEVWLSDLEICRTLSNQL